MHPLPRGGNGAGGIVPRTVTELDAEVDLIACTVAGRANRHERLAHRGATVEELVEHAVEGAGVGVYPHANGECRVGSRAEVWDGDVVIGAVEVAGAVEDA